MRKVSILISILLAVALSLCLTGPVFACEEVEEEECQWFLSDNYLGDVSDPPDTWDMYDMYRGNSTKPEGLVGIPSNGSVIWRADFVTLDVASFGTDPWTAKVTLNATTAALLEASGEEFFVYVGYIEGGVFTSVARGEVYEKSGLNNRIWRFSITVDSSFTVPAGAYLAFKIENTTSVPLGIRVGQSQGWIKPTGCPTYPTPELGALVLLGSGLACLGGYLVLKGRKKGACREITS